VSGVGLATKGLIAPEAAANEPSVVTSPPPPGFATQSASPTVQSDAYVVVVIPTAINTCLIAAENITDNLRAQQASDLQLPSLYKRAFLIAYETDEIALVRK
jgi:hypothetical protein